MMKIPGLSRTKQLRFPGPEFREPRFWTPELRAHKLAIQRAHVALAAFLMSTTTSLAECVRQKAEESLSLPIVAAPLPVAFAGWLLYASSKDGASQYPGHTSDAIEGELLPTPRDITRDPQSDTYKQLAIDYTASRSSEANVVCVVHSSAVTPPAA